MSAFAGALSKAARSLARISDTPRLDSELLLATALGIDRQRLLLDPPPSQVPDLFWSLIERRKGGEPIAYIIGSRAFWDIDIHVGPGVLVPRPDSETLISSAIAHFEDRAGPLRILDLGTGPGTLLLAALDIWPQATGVGIDISPIALSYARDNARRLECADRCDFRIGNWSEGLTERFDLLLCNPPYVAAGAALGPGVREHEPAEALFAGPQGLDCYRLLAGQVPGLVRPGGLAAIEIGSDQFEPVAGLFRPSGMEIALAHDLAGRPRALLLTWP